MTVTLLTLKSKTIISVSVNYDVNVVAGNFIIKQTRRLDTVAVVVYKVHAIIITMLVIVKVVQAN